MCGIFGHFDPRGADLDLVERMAGCLAHRGPDGHGTHQYGPLAFGATRLAIIDLSAPAGPIFNEDGRIAVVNNGEIYNFAALRAELESLGHVFKTRTDTEVLVHGYEQWGADVLSHLRGMFALCIWDDTRQRMLLARDRLGQKPLYYTRTSEAITFASEVKALFEQEGLRRAVNEEALPHFLAVGYVPPPQTLFAGIEKLAPGEIMLVEGGQIHKERYCGSPSWIPLAPRLTTRTQCAWSVTRSWNR